MHENKIVDWSVKMIFFWHMGDTCVGACISYLFMTFPWVHVFKIAPCFVYSSTVKPHCDLWSHVDNLQAGRRRGRAFSPARSSLRSMATTSTGVTTKRSWSTSRRSTHTRSLLKWWGDTNTHKRVLIRAQLRMFVWLRLTVDQSAPHSPCCKTLHETAAAFDSRWQRLHSLKNVNNAKDFQYS